MKKVSKYFSEVFKKYDDLNASVQENVAAQRVVKAYVREDYEIDKFHKASYNIYKMFKKAECTMAHHLARHAVYRIWLYLWASAGWVRT